MEILMKDFSIDVHMTTREILHRIFLQSGYEYAPDQKTISAMPMPVPVRSTLPKYIHGTPDTMPVQKNNPPKTSSTDNIISHDVRYGKTGEECRK